MDAQASPFSVQADDTARLDASADFQTIRQYLANQQGRRFCKSHKPSSPESQGAWLLQRDITHALILPVLHIHRQASQLAESMLCTRASADLELAFRGEARGAFSWLQCFVIDEQDWCSATGCPACIVTHVLQSEPTIRVVVAASRLSHYIHNADDKRSNPPTFSFWLHSLRTALHNDPFWGPGYWEEIEARALRLEKDIQHLLRQCRELEEILAFKSSGLEEKGGIENLPRITESTAFTATRIRHSTLAKRQLALITEEQEWMRRIVLAWWRALLADAACERRKGSLTRRPFAPPRARSLTS